MSISKSISSQSSADFHASATQFLLTWTPRLVVAAIAGYYSLGIAYDVGLMAAIDRVAISVLKDTVGYAGVGAVMPTFQWYASWGVRTIAAAGGGLVYDLTERTVLYFYNRCKNWVYPASQASSTWVRA